MNQNAKAKCVCFTCLCDSQKLLLLLLGPTDYSDVVRGTAATILARVLLQNTPFFSSMMASPAIHAALQQQSAAKGGLPPLLLFVDAWLDKVIGLLSALGLHVVLSRWPLIVALCSCL